MATVREPLFSAAAAGQIGKTLIFQTYNKKTYAKAYGKPDWDAHPPTAKQLAIQVATKTIMQHWPAISPTNQATWDLLAIPKRILRINAYLRENYKRIRSGLPITDVWPATDAITPSPKIYTGGTVTPNPAAWFVIFDSGGTLTQVGNEIWADTDLAILDISCDSRLDGQFDFTNRTNLTYIGLEYMAITTPPILANCPNITTLDINSTAITSTPNIEGCTSLLSLNLNDNALDDVDDVLNQLAALVDPSSYGNCRLDGGTNAAPTSASADAIAALTPPVGNWTITTN